MRKLIAFLTRMFALLASRTQEEVTSPAKSIGLPEHALADGQLMAADLFQLSLRAIPEIEKASGVLDEKGKCEALMFCGSVLLGDPAVRGLSCFTELSDHYLLSLYGYVKHCRYELGVIDFVGNRMTAYASECNRMAREQDYVSPWIYSAFYLEPLSDDFRAFLGRGRLEVFHQVLLKTIACLRERAARYLGLS